MTGATPTPSDVLEEKERRDYQRRLRKPGNIFTDPQGNYWRVGHDMKPHKITPDAK